MRWLCHPVVAAVIFNVAVIVSHIPGVVNASLENGALHYGVHLLVVVDRPVDVDAGVRTDPRVPHRHRGDDDLPVPAVGGADRAGGVADVRRGCRVPPYGEQPLRVWGLTVTEDQQLAGAIMKTGGSIFLWTIIVTLWFKRFSANYRHEHDYRPPAAGAPPLTLNDDVEREFARTAPPHGQPSERSR